MNCELACTTLNGPQVIQSYCVSSKRIVSSGSQFQFHSFSKRFCCNYTSKNTSKNTPNITFHHLASINRSIYYTEDLSTEPLRSSLLHHGTDVRYFLGPSPSRYRLNQHLPKSCLFVLSLISVTNGSLGVCVTFYMITSNFIRA
ncbi:hypothetical protein GYMLUDRAFT_901023 [Collybiopsis luxurians FD-317 M1]|uniref:Uncharacterized protein n=1 Tax=Collybiopsis luxurians FD-317 M1 TaxID=944289 RepID=A0A0D0C978_9AGAR|nr:hypothetical protein GYMLUDRAFT_901023 [Collybiopsis luxurians FD-317 M1]